jgi:hypothetical protein
MIFLTKQFQILAGDNSVSTYIFRWVGTWVGGKISRAAFMYICIYREQMFRKLCGCEMIVVTSKFEARVRSGKKKHARSILMECDQDTSVGIRAARFFSAKHTKNGKK